MHQCKRLLNVRFSFHSFTGIVDERLKNIEPKMVELIENEIMDNGAPVNWDDIAGLVSWQTTILRSRMNSYGLLGNQEFAKATIKEIVVWPMLRPDIFTGLRGPPKGISCSAIAE